MKAIATVLVLTLFAAAVAAGKSKAPCANAGDTDCDPPTGGGGNHHHKDCDDDDSSDVSFYTLNYAQCLAVDLQLVNIKQWTVKLKGDMLEAWFTLIVDDPNNFIVTQNTPYVVEPKGGIGSVVSSSCNPTLELAASGPEPLELKSKCEAVDLAPGIYRITGKVEIAKKSALAIARDADKRGTFVITTTFTTPGGKVVGCVQTLVGFCSLPDSSCDAAAGTTGGRKHHDEDNDPPVNLSELRCGSCGCNEPIVKKCANLLGLRNSCGQSFGQSPDKCCFKNCCPILGCDTATHECDAKHCRCVPKPCPPPAAEPPCKTDGGN